MVEPIEGDLFQFTNLTGNMSLPAHQYLLATEPSIMFATGIYAQAKWILPEVEKALNGRPLDYIFVSHLEADECGGIFLFKKKYPNVTVLCTSLIAGELPGFGYNGKIIVCDNRRGFTHGNLNLSFFSFPVESHGRDGLIVFDNTSGIMYSSDVIVKNSRARIDAGSWRDEVDAIDSARVQDTSRREKLKSELRNISPRFIATGHGSCIRIDCFRP